MNESNVILYTKVFFSLVVGLGAVVLFVEVNWRQRAWIRFGRILAAVTAWLGLSTGCTTWLWSTGHQVDAVLWMASYQYAALELAVAADFVWMACYLVHLKHGRRDDPLFDDLLVSPQRRSV